MERLVEAAVIHEVVMQVLRFRTRIPHSVSSAHSAARLQTLGPESRRTDVGSWRCAGIVRLRLFLITVNIFAHWAG